MSFDVVYWLRGTSHDDLCEVSKRSVRKAWGEHAQIYVYHDAEVEPAMLANIRVQLDHLQRTPAGRWVLFLDADVLVLRDFGTLSGIWNADMLVTWRDKVNGEESRIASLMPYNYGVIGCEVSPQIVEAWMWMYNRVCHMHDKYQDWYGNQLALAELVGARTRSESGTDCRDTPIRWTSTSRAAHTTISVKQVPCEQYNYTPEEVGEDVSEKRVLHFKGNRKDMMTRYAEELGI